MRLSESEKAAACHESIVARLMSLIEVVIARVVFTMIDLKLSFGDRVVSQLHVKSL